MAVVSHLTGVTAGCGDVVCDTRRYKKSHWIVAATLLATTSWAAVAAFTSPVLRRRHSALRLW